LAIYKKFTKSEILEDFIFIALMAAPFTLFLLPKETAHLPQSGTFILAKLKENFELFEYFDAQILTISYEGLFAESLRLKITALSVCQKAFCEKASQLFPALNAILLNGHESSAIRLLACDLDSTIIEQETIDLMAEELSDAARDKIQVAIYIYIYIFLKRDILIFTRTSQSVLCGGNSIMRIR
jgi:hypothetical protein